MVTVNPSSSAGTSKFYVDPGCGSEITSRTIAVGARLASFYFKNTLAGTPTLTAKAIGLTAATQQETFQ